VREKKEKDVPERGADRRSQSSSLHEMKGGRNRCPQSEESGTRGRRFESQTRPVGLVNFMKRSKGEDYARPRLVEEERELETARPFRNAPEGGGGKSRGGEKGKENAISFRSRYRACTRGPIGYKRLKKK